LAFTGNPSSLGGILAAGTGTGPGRGTVVNKVRRVIVSLPEPAYPVRSRQLGEEGRVTLKVEISAEGGVRRAEVVESSTYDRLDRAALDAARLARFSPVTDPGSPAAWERTVAYTFRLEE
jgi:protein TonB